MFDVGFMELVLVSVIGLLVLGPQRLPKVAAEIGKWIGRARRTATQLRRQLEREIELSDLQTPPPPPPPPAQPPPSPTQPPPAEPAESAVPRSGEVPDGPGTHADPPDSAVSPAIAEPERTTLIAAPKAVRPAGEGARERLEDAEPPKS